MFLKNFPGYTIRKLDCALTCVVCFFLGRAALQLVPYLGIVAAHCARESENKVKKQTGPIVIFTSRLIGTFRSLH